MDNRRTAVLGRMVDDDAREILGWEEFGAAAGARRGHRRPPRAELRRRLTELHRAP
jgi:hypothetical protein